MQSAAAAPPSPSAPLGAMRGMRDLLLPVLVAAALLDQAAQVDAFPEAALLGVADGDQDGVEALTTPTTPKYLPFDCVHRAPPWYAYCDNDDFWSAAVQLALAFGACFVVVAAGLVACRAMIRRASAARGGDGDSDSVSSMQRWINERQRDRPPRYEEMASSASSAAAPATVSGTASNEAEKPPPYELALSRRTGREDASVNAPPPPYTAMTMALLGDPGHGFSNPCFLEDAGEPPPYSAAPTSPGPASPESSPTANLSSGTSPSSESSLTSLSSMSSASSGSETTPQNLLTVSQALAVREMMLADAVTTPERTDLFWTSLY